MKFAVIIDPANTAHLIGLRYGELTALYVDNATDPEEFAASELSLGSGAPRVYITQRQAVSPRHLYLVTDPAGQLLIRPHQVTVAERTAVAEICPWTYPADGGQPWFDPLPPADARKRRLA